MCSVNKCDVALGLVSSWGDLAAPDGANITLLSPWPALLSGCPETLLGGGGLFTRPTGKQHARLSSDTHQWDFLETF